MSTGVWSTSVARPMNPLANTDETGRRTVTTKEPLRVALTKASSRAELQARAQTDGGHAGVNSFNRTLKLGRRDRPSSTPGEQSGRPTEHSQT